MIDGTKCNCGRYTCASCQWVDGHAVEYLKSGMPEKPARPVPGDVEAAWAAIQIAASDWLLSTAGIRPGDALDSEARLNAAVRAYGDARAAQEKARADALAEKLRAAHDALDDAIPFTESDCHDDEIERSAEEAIHKARAILDAGKGDEVGQ